MSRDDCPIPIWRKPGDFRTITRNLARDGVAVHPRVNVRDLLVKPPLRGADVLNPPHQLLEIVERQVGILQPLIVEDETFHDVFPQPLWGSDAEAGGRRAFHPVADGDDGIEIVESGRVVLAVGGSGKGFLYH